MLCIYSKIQILTLTNNNIFCFPKYHLTVGLTEKKNYSKFAECWAQNQLCCLKKYKNFLENGFSYDFVEYLLNYGDCKSKVKLYTGQSTLSFHFHFFVNPRNYTCSTDVLRLVVCTIVLVLLLIKYSRLLPSHSVASPNADIILSLTKLMYHRHT